jgi:hypothetical protein
LPTRSGVSGPVTTIQGWTAEPAQGWRCPHGVATLRRRCQFARTQPMRMLFPKGSRNPKSIP